MKIIYSPFYKSSEAIFTYDGAQAIIGGTWLPILHKQVKASGVELVLAERYLGEKKYSSHDLFISDGITVETQQLLATPARPLLLFSGESPNVDWKLYTFVSGYSKHFDNVLLFAGARKHIHKRTVFHQYLWPNNSKLINRFPAGAAGRKPNTLVMVASNKKQHSLSSNSRLSKGAKAALMKLITNTVPSVKLKDLYAARMAAIRFFANREYFKLYGKNWENLTSLNIQERKAIVQLQPHAVQDKLELLSRFEFALCFENCIYPGYITEKIFDCFFAKCIPVYLGAPDIEEYLPADLFIDMRSFKNFNELESHLMQLTPQEKQEYRNKMMHYLESDLFTKFSDRFFAQNIFDLVKQHM